MLQMMIEVSSLRFSNARGNEHIHSGGQLSQTETSFNCNQRELSSSDLFIWIKAIEANLCIIRATSNPNSLLFSN